MNLHIENGKAQEEGNMRGFRTRVVIIGMVFLLSAVTPAVYADEALPAEQVIAAIRTAVAAHPGKIKEVEVERKRGRLFVEVEIVSDTEGIIKVYVDPEKGEVIRR